MPQLEQPPAGEGDRIANIVRLTIEQMRKRYPAGMPALRGVHAKGHGCVMARCKVREDLPEELRVGVFANPGREYQAWIRFSNATVSLTPDSPAASGKPVHGSRGMAIKLMGVDGSALLPANGPMTQDFLLVNHPVFPFANVEDYEALSRILLEDNDNPARFFSERIRREADGTPDMADPITQRAVRTAGIVKRIQSLSPPDAFQAPPASPVDNQYFSAAPLLFGEDRAMKISAKPVAPVTDKAPDLTDPDYLRKALHERLSATGARDVVFELLLQVRSAKELAGQIDEQIENASGEWEATSHPFVAVGTITIPPQDFEAEDRLKFCEGLIFTPWHGIAEHRPLGGLNRLRRAVYEASAIFRHVPKEPAQF